MYYVYSRGERQRGGNEFKDPWQIKEKVNYFRETQNPNFSIQDVYDVVALTGVCVYPSDIKLVEEFVRSRHDLRVVGARDIDETGYKARHLLLALRDAKYVGICVELQLKTILHDAWSAKTHDLTYKPQGPVSAAFERYMAPISKQLSALDEQTEEMRKEIEKQWQWERRRKDALRLTILKAALRMGPDNPERNAEFRSIADGLCQAEVEYMEGDVSGMLSRIRAFRKGVDDGYSSVLIAVLAAIRKNDDLDETAIDWIDRWVYRSENKERIIALVVKSNTLYGFGRISEAIEVGERALELAEAKGMAGAVHQCKVNLADYLAEWGGNPRTRERAARRALSLIEDVMAHGIERPSQRDTVGFVKIVFGRSRSEILEGLELCRQAYEEDSGDEVRQAYCDHHRQLAERRLESPDLVEHGEK